MVTGIEFVFQLRWKAVTDKVLWGKYIYIFRPGDTCVCYMYILVSVTLVTPVSAVLTGDSVGSRRNPSGVAEMAEAGVDHRVL